MARFFMFLFGGLGIITLGASSMQIGGGDPTISYVLLAIAAMFTVAAGRRSGIEERARTEKQCSKCMMVIHKDASICPHCRSEQD